MHANLSTLGPAESRPFRGWWVLAGLFMVYAASNGIMVHSLPLLYPHLIDEFGWTEAQVTLPATLLLTISALTSPPVGALLDRYSARLLIAVGAFGTILGLALHAGVTELWHMVSAYVVFALALSLSGVVANMLVLSRWFRKFHGRAAGILLMASSLGGTLFPLALGYGINEAGWRITLLLLAVLAGGLMLPAVIFLVRDRPQADGYGPDGVPLSQVPAPGDTMVQPEGITLWAALKSRNFYLLAVGTAAVWFSVLSLLQHQSIYLGRDLAVSSTRLPLVFSAFFAASIVGKLLFGFLGDRFRKDRVMVASIALLLIGLALLRELDGDQAGPLFLYAIIAGAGFSGAFTSIQVLLAHFFAGPSFGKILAALVLIDTLAGALGTRIVANIRGAHGSYLPAIELMMVLCTAAIVCILLVRFQSAPAPSNKEVRQ